MTLTADLKQRLRFALTSESARDELSAILDSTTPDSATNSYKLSQLEAELSANVTAFPTGGQTSATLIAAQQTRVTVCATAGDSVKLPLAVTALVGVSFTIINDGAAACDVFPSTGDTLNSLAANTAFRLAVGSQLVARCVAVGAYRFSAPGAPVAKFTTDATGTQTVPALLLTGAGFVVAQNTAAGAIAWTTRTATQMFADHPNAVIGGTYVLRITNTGNNTVTLTAGAGVTATGTMTIATATTRDFIVTFTSATALVIQSVSIGSIA